MAAPMKAPKSQDQACVGLSDASALISPPNYTWHIAKSLTFLYLSHELAAQKGQAAYLMSHSQKVGEPGPGCGCDSNTLFSSLLGPCLSWLPGSIMNPSPDLPGRV